MISSNFVGCSTGITPLRRYCGPIRHPLAVRPLPRVAGYRADVAPPLSRWGEEGFSSRSTCPGHRAVALTPPERPAASTRCDVPCCLRLSTVRLGLRGSVFRGHLCVHFRYGPGTHSPSFRWLCRWASESWFPSTLPPELRGSGSYPGGAASRCTRQLPLVARLIASSKVVARSTGRSAGFAPLKIRST